MEYTNLQLIAFLLLYGILGWCLETAYAVLKQRRFVNRGFFSLPICPQYGVMMDILIIALPTLKDHLILQFLMTLTVVSAVDYLSGALSKRIWRKKFRAYERSTLFGGEVKGSALAAAKAAAVLVTALLIHPFVFLAVELIPETVLRLICAAALLVLLADFLAILYVIRRSVRADRLEEAQRELFREQFSRQNRLGGKIYRAMWKRLDRAYPEMERIERPDSEKPVFARGICLDKLFWVFIICAFLGDLIETLYCRVTGGVWMSRSSVIYGWFSIVWGAGAVLLTVVLQRLAKKDDRYVFLAGAVLGGVYEYMCSLFTEVFLGTTFWDYSWMPFNIGGRTNLLYCIFWGLLSVVWVKICYPVISGWIEKLPPLKAKAATWALILLMCCDALLSAAVMIRYVDRKAGEEADNAVEIFLDANYPDEMVERVWPNMKIQ